MKGRCISVGDTSTLQIGQEYFLFPAGPNHYYVSRFNNVDAHFGCYQARYFDLMKETALEFRTKEDRFIGTSEMDGIRLKKGIVYVLGPVLYTWGRVQENCPSHCYVYEIEKDFERFIGCFPISVFRDIHLYNDKAIIEKVAEDQEEQQEAEQSAPEDSEVMSKENPIGLIERENGQLSFF